MMTYLIAIQPTNHSYEIEVIADSEDQALIKASNEECVELYRCRVIDSWTV